MRKQEPDAGQAVVRNLPLARAIGEHGMGCGDQTPGRAVRPQLGQQAAGQGDVEQIVAQQQADRSRTPGLKRLQLTVERLDRIGRIAHQQRRYIGKPLQARPGVQGPVHEKIGEQRRILERAQRASADLHRAHGRPNVDTGQQIRIVDQLPVQLHRDPGFGMDEDALLLQVEEPLEFPRIESFGFVQGIAQPLQDRARQRRTSGRGQQVDVPRPFEAEFAISEHRQRRALHEQRGAVGRIERILQPRRFTRHHQRGDARLLRRPSELAGHRLRYGNPGTRQRVMHLGIDTVPARHAIDPVPVESGRRRTDRRVPHLAPRPTAAGDDQPVFVQGRWHGDHEFQINADGSA
eukprot:Opistho-1_new@6977